MKGFTLVEMLAALFVFGLISAAGALVMGSTLGGQAAVRARQKSIKGDPAVADSVAAIDRNTLGSYRLQPGTRPHAPIAISEFLPAV